MKHTLCVAMLLIATNSYTLLSLDLKAVSENLRIKSIFSPGKLICNAGNKMVSVPDVLQGSTIIELPVCISLRTNSSAPDKLFQSKNILSSHI